MIKKSFNFLLLSYILISTSPAFAAITKAQSILTKFETELKILSFGVVTLAVMYIGYKMLFKGGTFSELWLVALGAIVIAAAPQIAKIFTG